MTNKCRICPSGVLGKLISIPEHMFGIGESFNYSQCSQCRCLQIVELPDDIGNYYPENYYSFTQTPGSALSEFKVRLRTLLAINGPALLFGGRDWWEIGDLKSVRDARVQRSARILDIGCGSGWLIARLKNIGFHNVLGADPFIAGDIVHPNGARVVKRPAVELEGPFDVVMMHHSLEHVWDQQEAVQSMHRLLAPGGRCIVRIPTVECWAWEEYGCNWVQLDAPRHFYLHSRKSIAELCASAGLEVERIVDDSGPFQILGSEKLRLGGSIIDADNSSPNFERHLPKSVIKTASATARRLNQSQRGDSIAIHAIRPN